MSLKLFFLVSLVALAWIGAAAIIRALLSRAPKAAPQTEEQ
jgi:hypothetical protein